MKTWKRFGSWSGLLLAVMLSASCGSGPGIEILRNPVPRTAGSDLTIGGKDYSSTTRAILEETGLKRQVKKDPAATIQELDRRLSQNRRPEFRLAAAEIAIEQAFRNYRAREGEVMGYLLTAIELSESGLSLDESTVRSNLVEIYNEGNAELAYLLHQQAKGKQRIAAQGPLRRYVVGWGGGRGEQAQPGYYDTLNPASRIKVRGFESVNRRAGVGGSMVGYRAPTEERKAKDPFMPPNSGYALALTSVVEFGKNGSAKVVLHDLGDEETVVIDGKRHTLAGDFTAATATSASAAPKPAAGWIGMMRPERNKKLGGLFSLEPYREDRIPLVLVHGLLSTPGTWREVINIAYSDTVIRENYQIMVFFYPTGYPIAQNAADLRDALKAYQKLRDPNRTNPNMRKMVMVGHSMGCNLTNFQIRDGGDKLWSKFFTKPVEELGLEPQDVERARRAAYFKANPDIARVVFVCGPHRGSPLSNAWLGRFGASLIRLPFHAINELSGNMLSETTALGQSVFDEPTSSINNLKEHSPILEALLEQPIPYKPKIHTIIGDRGKGDGVNSSDGVVPYWSAHLDVAHTEEFVPASHTAATNDNENVKAVRRILYKHVGKKYPAGE